MDVLHLVSLMDIPDDSEKLLEEFSLKVSPTDKHVLDSMPTAIKKEMLKDLRRVIRGYGHMTRRIEGE